MRGVRTGTQGRGRRRVRKREKKNLCETDKTEKTEQMLTGENKTYIRVQVSFMHMHYCYLCGIRSGTSRLINKNTNQWIIPSVPPCRPHKQTLSQEKYKGWLEPANSQYTRFRFQRKCLQPKACTLIVCLIAACCTKRFPFGPAGPRCISTVATQYDPAVWHFALHDYLFIADRVLCTKKKQGMPNVPMSQILSVMCSWKGRKS